MLRLTGQFYFNCQRRDWSNKRVTISVSRQLLCFIYENPLTSLPPRPPIMWAGIRPSSSFVLEAGHRALPGRLSFQPSAPRITVGKGQLRRGQPNHHQLPCSAGPRRGRTMLQAPQVIIKLFESNWSKRRGDRRPYFHVLVPPPPSYCEHSVGRLFTPNPCPARGIIQSPILTLSSVLTPELCL